MTDRAENRVRKSSSLYVGMLCAILVGAIVAGSVYIVCRFFTNFVIENYYADSSSKTNREADYVEDLQKFVTENKMSSEDHAKIGEWVLRNRYVYLMIYKDSELIFSSDMVEPDDEAANIVQGATGGITVDYPKREELIEYAEQNGLYPIATSDGLLFASVAEFTEYLYYDIANMVALTIAVLAMSFFIINYFRRVIGRIKRLAADVTVVSDGNMNHAIISEGYDEISKLSSDVEQMRTSILENLARERKIMDANTELITSISHDIRTPLTVLLGYIDMMKERAEEDEVMRGYLAASERTAMRLKHLSDDMFKYSLAFCAPEEAVKLEEYDAATLLDQILAEHILLLGENGYKVEYDVSRLESLDGVSVKTDAQYLMRIIDNIFSNLSKYADREKKIRISIAEVDGLIELTVINRISKALDKVESTGIGLKTCARLAEIIADGFEYIKGDDSFAITLRLRAHRPRPEPVTEKTQPRVRVRWGAKQNKN